MLEKEVEKKLIDGIRKLGGRTYKWVSPGNNGVPDRIAIMPGGRILFCELKTTTGQVSKLQKLQISLLSQLGCDVRVIYGPDGVQDLLDRLTAWMREGRYGV